MPAAPQLTTVLEGPERIRISANCKNGKITQCYFNELPSQNLYYLFMRGFKISADKPCLGTRQSPGAGPYHWITFREVKEMAECVGSALISLGHTPRQSQKIGIYSANRYEWDVAQLANNTYSFVTVPLYDTLGVESIAHIVSVTDMRVIFCDDAAKVKKLLSIRDQVPQLGLVVTMESLSADLVASLKKANVAHQNFTDLVHLGKSTSCGKPVKQTPQPPLDEDELALILFTSGTTGTPKGVMLSNRNIVTDVGAIHEHCSSFFEVTNEDCVISYLPQAHGFNQCSTHVMLAFGARVGYLSGSVFNLLADVKELRPTLFPIVPRLLNRIYDTVWQKATGNSVKRYLLKRAYETKRLQMETGMVVKKDLADKLVFKKIHKLLGGRVRCMITGSAPVSAEVLTFIRAAVGCQVLEGYGQTETTAGSTVSLPTDYSPGHVGVPLTCCEIKLVDIPEMNYNAWNNQGEVCVRGPHCFKGYWKDAENTRSTLDEAGWVHTGDVGMWTEAGNLKIIDRKKNIFKLAQGEYIAPEKIENIYTQAPVVQQVFVHGDSLEPCCVAVVVPDRPVLEEMATSQLGIDVTSQSWPAICANPHVRKLVLEQMHVRGNAAKLNKLEQVKSVYLWTEVFSIENDLLTPTMKSKRPQLRSKFTTEIKNMYSEMASEGNSS
jgi:long-chain acyl-CoA synthetase